MIQLQQLRLRDGAINAVHLDGEHQRAGCLATIRRQCTANPILCQEQVHRLATRGQARIQTSSANLQTTAFCGRDHKVEVADVFGRQTVIARIGGKRTLERFNQAAAAITTRQRRVVAACQSSGTAIAGQQRQARQTINRTQRTKRRAVILYGEQARKINSIRITYRAIQNLFDRQSAGSRAEKCRFIESRICARIT